MTGDDELKDLLLTEAEPSLFNYTEEQKLSLVVKSQTEEMMSKKLRKLSFKAH